MKSAQEIIDWIVEEEKRKEEIGKELLIKLKQNKIRNLLKKSSK